MMSLAAAAAILIKTHRINKAIMIEVANKAIAVTSVNVTALTIAVLAVDVIVIAAIDDVEQCQKLNSMECI